MSSDKQEAKREMPGLVLLWNYPEIWWRRRNWLVRLMVLVAVCGSIAAASIAVYDARVRSEHERLLRMQSEKVVELDRLIREVRGEREEVARNSENQVLEEIEKIKEQLREVQRDSGTRESSLLNTSVEEALRVLELAYPATGSAGTAY